MKCLISLLRLLLALLLGACAAPSTSHTLTIFAASSLTEAFKEIGQGFEKENPNVLVIFNFGGSQLLRTQLEQGASADLFASADLKQMDAAMNSGVVASGAAKIFTTNQLVVITPQGNPAKIQKLQDLARPQIKLILASADVPAGAYAREALSKMEKTFGPGYKENVLKNIVSNEDNVRQVVAKVQLGEADAGIVYGTDAVAVSPLMTLFIPAEFNVSAQYPIAPLAQTKQKELATQFIAYLLSPRGQDILQKRGFGRP